MRIAVVMHERVGPHKDTDDLRDGWALMTCFGDFTGGHLCLPRLKVEEAMDGDDMEPTEIEKGKRKGKGRRKGKRKGKGKKKAKDEERDVRGGIQFPYGEGDVVMFRATVLEHFITQFKGERTSLVFFTKGGC